MSDSYHVRLESDSLVFSAAHFITFGGKQCEPLHGHNWRVSAEVHGALDENQYVIDFLALDKMLKAILQELDHRVLLPTDHPLMKVEAGDEQVTVTFEERRWLFPRGDCALLPMQNTTAEQIARYVGRRLLDQIASRTGTRPHLARIGVEEGMGQWAVCELHAT